MEGEGGILVEMGDGGKIDSVAWKAAVRTGVSRWRS